MLGSQLHQRFPSNISPCEMRALAQPLSSTLQFVVTPTRALVCCWHEAADFRAAAFLSAIEPPALSFGVPLQNHNVNHAVRQLRR